MIAALLLLTPVAQPQDAVQWDRDVQPILTKHCFACHGRDEAARQADLRLDLVDVHDDARGIVSAGDDGQTELLRRITAADPDERMPPRSEDKPLNAEQIETLRRWVEQGAPYQDHWSFRPVGHPEPPQVQHPQWVRGPIDSFVLAELEQRGLAPSPEADRRTLIRRVSLDLCGVAPSPVQVEDFVRDNRPDAYERLVDRLLDSDAYAERMTLAWMDAARYGDTSVYHADGPRDMWPWRDWVIEAYRSNLPFDQFTTWQLAGDLLPDATTAQQVASGFHRNNGTSDEGGAIDEELRVSYMVDRVKTTGNVWMGLSLECAQCHDHKYDPVGMRDYYRIYAFFNQADEKGFQTRGGNAVPLISVPTPDQLEERDGLAQEVLEREQQLSSMSADSALYASWREGQRAELLALALPTPGTWRAMGPFKAASSSAAFKTDFGPEAAGNPLEFTNEERTWVERPEWADGEPHSLGSAGNSAFYLYRTITAEHASKVALSLGSDDTIQVWLNGEQLLAKEVGRGVAPDQEKVELDLQAGENRFLLKICNGGGPSGFYFKLLGTSLPDAIAASLRAAPEERSDEQRAALASYHLREVWEPGRETVAAIAAVQARQAQLTTEIVTSMVMRDVSDGRQTYVLNRGQYDAPLMDQPVEPGVLETLLPMPEGAPPTRLGLARWLTSPEQPLTPRVAVNRYWAMLFGRGLVGTVMDFGSQGEFPSHPQLLDWLARDFVASGWDVQRSLRQMVTSATYRQASDRRAELDALDPENRLLGRASRFRLQGEFIRDQALSVSGLLVDQVGGPSVKPYQPAGLWNEVSLNRGLRFRQDTDEKLYRKSMYIYWKRSAPMPVMTIFDAPTREKCVVQRQRTNTPLQALVVLNDVQFVEAARHLAARMLAAGDTFERRLDEGFLRCTARPAHGPRRAIMRDVLRETLEGFRADPERALALLGVGESPRDERLDPAEHAAWTVLASMILNLDETLTRE